MICPHYFVMKKKLAYPHYVIIHKVQLLTTNLVGYEEKGKYLILKRQIGGNFYKPYLPRGICLYGYVQVKLPFWFFKLDFFMRHF